MTYLLKKRVWIFILEKNGRKWGLCDVTTESMQSTIRKTIIQVKKFKEHRDWTSPSNAEKYLITGEDLIIHVEHQEYCFIKIINPICFILSQVNQGLSCVGYNNSFIITKRRSNMVQFGRWRDSFSSMLYTPIEHARSSNYSVHHIRT